MTLALDASTYGGSVAVLRDGIVLEARTVAMRGEHEERLLPAVVECLHAARVTPDGIDRIACGAGPGSFTSLRIAASLAKGLAVARTVPLVTASSLSLAVAACEPPLAAGAVFIAMDAMRGEVYLARVTVLASGQVAADGGYALVPRDVAVVTAAEAGLPLVGPSFEIPATPHARGFARLAPTDLREVDVGSWEPLYGRLAEAQVRWEQAHGRPLIAERDG